MIYINTVILVLLVLLCILFYIYTRKIDKLLTQLNKEKPQTKTKRPSYNPANLFNPYSKDDLDPVVPDYGERKR